MPEGISESSAGLALLLVSPLLVFALSLISRRISGGLIARTLILAGFTYVTYTLNTLLEAMVFVSAYSSLSSSSFTFVSALISSLLSSLVIAMLFPPLDKSRDFASAWRTFFAQKSRGELWWRLLAAAVAFVPVYLLFGFLVNPFTGNYYNDAMFGLRAAGWAEILPVLFLRSFLFLLVCLPIIVAWQGSARSLFFRLGTSLFILVGLLYMLTGYWLPLNVRIPHAIEILLDSLVYAGVLVWLLTKRPSTRRASSMNL
jgi:hypothetical protein